MADIAEIKRKTTCVEYARRQGWKLRADGPGRFRCAAIWRGGDNPTAVIIEDFHWHDFKTGDGGSVIDLCMMNENLTFGEALKALGGDTRQISREIEYINKLCGRAQYYHEQLRPEDREYLNKRRIEDSTIDFLRIGYDPQSNRITFPYFNTRGGVEYFVSRERGGGGPKYKKDKLDGMNSNIPWGLHTLRYPTEYPLVIAEGVMDAISFNQDGKFRVLSPFGGFFSRQAKIQALDICAAQEHGVCVIFDSDGAGQKFQHNFAIDLHERGIKFTCGRLPDGVKDVSEYYEAGGDLLELIKNAEPGIIAMAKTIEDKRDFEFIVRKIARGMTEPEIVEMFEALSGLGKFSATWLAALQKSALRPPSDDAIVKELNTSTKLRYSSGMGFFEYDDGVWQRREDDEIGAMIGAALKRHRTGGRITSIFKVMKTDAIKSEKFNELPIINFRNGTLDLDTCAFREHREEDLSSIQLPYAYDENADCPLWRETVEDILSSDEDKISLLQEAFGYVMFTTNCLQKCFLLLGRGANGKSVVLSVLRGVFGEANTTTVEMTGLADPFQRIRLAHSMLNISTEAKSSAEGAETYFKQAVSGDPINGSFKYRDAFDYVSRAKWFIAANAFIESRDPTYGYLRRFIFINFNETYATAPAAGQKKADPALTDKLMDELPGIFNWALSGYQTLKKQGNFTRTEDNEETMRRYELFNDPLLSFVEDSAQTLTGTITKSEVYKAYRTWCDANGHKPCASNKFSVRLKDTFKKQGRNITETRTGVGGRSWRFD